MMTARVIHIYNVIFSYDTGTNTMSGHMRKIMTGGCGGCIKQIFI